MHYKLSRPHDSIKKKKKIEHESLRLCHKFWYRTPGTSGGCVTRNNQMITVRFVNWVIHTTALVTVNTNKMPGRLIDSRSQPDTDRVRVDLHTVYMVGNSV